MRTTRSASENRRPRRKRSCIKLKMAVFIPMPSASVKTAINVNPGDLRSWRRANLRSFISFGAQGLDWINMCRATCRDLTCGKSNQCQQDCGTEEGEWVGCCHAEKHAGEKP